MNKENMQQMMEETAQSMQALQLQFLEARAIFTNENHYSAYIEIILKVMREKMNPPIFVSPDGKILSYNEPFPKME